MEEHTALEQFWCETLGAHKWFTIARGATRGRKGTIEICDNCGCIRTRVGMRRTFYMKRFRRCIN